MFGNAQPRGGETIDAAQRPSAWQPMRDAPRNRPIILRATWEGRAVAIIGQFRHIHGCFVGQAIYGGNEMPIHATGWHDVPALDELFA